MSKTLNIEDCPFMNMCVIFIKNMHAYIMSILHINYNGENDESVAAYVNRCLYEWLTALM